MLTVKIQKSKVETVEILGVPVERVDFSRDHDVFTFDRDYYSSLRFLHPPIKGYVIDAFNKHVYMHLTQDTINSLYALKATDVSNYYIFPSNPIVIDKTKLGQEIAHSYLSPANIYCINPYPAIVLRNGTYIITIKEKKSEILDLTGKLYSIFHSIRTEDLGDLFLEGDPTFTASLTLPTSDEGSIALKSIEKKKKSKSFISLGYSLSTSMPLSIGVDMPCWNGNSASDTVAFNRLLNTISHTKFVGFSKLISAGSKRNNIQARMTSLYASHMNLIQANIKCMGLNKSQAYNLSSSNSYHSPSYSSLSQSLRGLKNAIYSPSIVRKGTTEYMKNNVIEKIMLRDYNLSNVLGCKHKDPEYASKAGDILTLALYRHHLEVINAINPLVRRDDTYSLPTVEDVCFGYTILSLPSNIFIDLANKLSDQELTAPLFTLSNPIPAPAPTAIVDNVVLKASDFIMYINNISNDPSTSV